MSAGIVIAGGGLVAQRACERLRRRGYDGSLTIVCEEELPPYDRPPLSKEHLAGEGNAAALQFRSADWYAEQGIELLLGECAAALDAGARRITLESGAPLPYSQLLIATGAAPRRLPGTEDFDNVHTLRTAADAAALRERLRPGASVAVVGAGFIGQEVAATARGLGCEVTMVEAAQTPLASLLGPAVGSWFTSLHRAHGVTVIANRTTAAFHGGDSLEVLELDDGRRVRCDAVVVGIGVSANAAWVAGSGLDPAAIEVDACGRTELPGVFAAGDVTRRGGHWEAAARSAQAAADAMLGLEPAPPSLPAFWSDQYGLRIQYVGQAGRADEVTTEGDPGERDFAFLFHRGGHQVAALLVNRPHALPEHRRLIELAEPHIDSQERKAA